MLHIRTCFKCKTACCKYAFTAYIAYSACLHMLEVRICCNTAVMHMTSANAPSDLYSADNLKCRCDLNAAGSGRCDLVYIYIYIYVVCHHCKTSSKHATQLTDHAQEGKESSIDWISEWMNEWVNEWISEWMNECSGRQAGGEGLAPHDW